MAKRNSYQPTFFDEFVRPEPAPPVQADTPPETAGLAAEPALPPETTPPVLPPSIIPVNFPESWLRAIGSEFAQPYFAELRKFVSAERQQFEVHPPAADVFNAFRQTPLDRVRVVILGQDPYPTPGHAHGLCFSVRRGVPIPASLRNIYRELYDDLGITPAAHGCLESWARQGVLLLNAVLTVRSRSPNSHKDRGWEQFTDAALRAVSRLPRRVIFVLWGSYAQKKAAVVDPTRHAILRSVHPSPMSADGGFFGSRPFSRVNAILEQQGESPIQWAIND